jgi:hypothetical protein
MKAESSTTKLLSLELKYCERCGGLWLRPVGGGQIYCVDCGRSMAELPPASYEVRNARVPQGPRWGRRDDTKYKGCEKQEEGLVVNAGEGVA